MQRRPGSRAARPAARRHSPGDGTYTNPVWDGYFADPFILPAAGAYYAYGTDIPAEGRRVLPVLRSDDLVRWTPLGDALERPSVATAQQYWAPEVVERDGTFYLYYSTGIRDTQHRIRVASAQHPAGPFRDHGKVLTGDDPFSIDPHPFRDDDGQWYLYYARDFLDGERVGTALVVDRMMDVETLEGSPRTVLRASADWQIFMKRRPMYGAVYDWYTLEGPSVVKRDGRYYCFYSGGAWERENYGVSYVVAESPLGPFAAPREHDDGPLVLQTVPGRVLGPGHCSVVTAADEDFIVYHAWDPGRTARRMCIDRLEWSADGPRCSGPTWRPQPRPHL